MQFLKDITHRDGSGSSKKLWYNGACLAATICLFWLTYKLPTEHGVEDWVYVWLYAIYLVTVGGFEVLLQMMKLLISWKTGSNPNVETKKEEA